MDLDYARLDYQLDRIASKRGLPAKKVLEEWLEMCESNEVEDWRQMDGIPCIMGGLTVLCGEFCNCRAFCGVFKYVTGRLDG